MNNELKSLIILKFGTQSDFAKEMKVDESYVSRVIRGRTPLRAEMRTGGTGTWGKRPRVFLIRRKSRHD